MYSAKNKMIPGLPRRGDMDLNTPLDAMHLFEPETIQERHKFLVDVMNKKKKEREFLYDKLGRPNKSNINKWKNKVHRHRQSDTLDRYFMLGEEILNHAKEISEIKAKIKKIKIEQGLGFEETFIDIAREVLPEKTYKDLIYRTRIRCGQLT